MRTRNLRVLTVAIPVWVEFPMIHSTRGSITPRMHGSLATVSFSTVFMTYHLAAARSLEAAFPAGLTQSLAAGKRLFRCLQKLAQPSRPIGPATTAAVTTECAPSVQEILPWTRSMPLGTLAISSGIDLSWLETTSNMWQINFSIPMRLLRLQWAPMFLAIPGSQERTSYGAPEHGARISGCTRISRSASA